MLFLKLKIQFDFIPTNLQTHLFLSSLCKTEGNNLLYKNEEFFDHSHTPFLFMLHYLKTQLRNPFLEIERNMQNYFISNMFYPINNHETYLVTVQVINKPMCR